MTSQRRISTAGIAAFALIAAAALPNAAVAKHGHGHQLAPPGNSGIGQYVESVPTARGSQPINTIHPHHNRSHGGGGAGGSQGGPPSGNSSAVSNSTAKALAAQGPAGSSAASLAQATAPSRPRVQGHRANGVSLTPGAQPAEAGGSPSSVNSVLSALTGSSSSGGLGLLLPGLLIVVFLGAAMLAVARYRKTT
jgi:hypothetical protein